MSLLEQTNEIITILKSKKPDIIENIVPDLYWLAPYVVKQEWEKLGDKVKERETLGSSSHSIDGSKWISLRLDGSKFSSVVKMLRNKGIIEPQGFSYKFAKCMQDICLKLIEHFNASFGFTQSDEVIIFIPPSINKNGDLQEHYRNGRVIKIASLAAGIASSKFMGSLTEFCIKSNNIELIFEINKILPHFDCRLGYYNSWEEAKSLLLWRAYDCSVNGISDAVHQSNDGKKIVKENTFNKIKWLYENSYNKINISLLPRHQAYGTLYRKTKRVIIQLNRNPKREDTDSALVAKERKFIEKENLPILDLEIKGWLDNAERESDHENKLIGVVENFPKYDNLMKSLKNLIYKN